MKFEEKYNLIISYIEEHISEKTSDIALAVSKELTCGQRSLSETFTFITGLTMAEYIGRRKMIHALDRKTSEGCSWERIVPMYGFNDASSFSRKFKSVFNCSPTDVIEEKATIEMTEPLYLEEVLLMNTISTLNNDIDKYGTLIDLDTYKTVEELQTCGALYGLVPEEQLELYKISKTSGYDFDFICELYDSLVPVIYDDEDLNYLRKILEVANANEINSKWHIMILSSIMYDGDEDIDFDYFKLVCPNENSNLGISYDEYLEIKETCIDIGIEVDEHTLGEIVKLGDENKTMAWEHVVLFYNEEQELMDDIDDFGNCFIPKIAQEISDDIYFEEMESKRDKWM